MLIKSLVCRFWMKFQHVFDDGDFVVFVACCVGLTPFAF